MNVDIYLLTFNDYPPKFWNTENMFCLFVKKLNAIDNTNTDP